MEHIERNTLKVAMTGAGGLIGRALCERLAAAGHVIFTLVRRPPTTDREVPWYPDLGIADATRLNGIDTVIHLAGENIAASRWTRRRMAAIRQSRVDATNRLVSSLAALSNPPRRFFCASAVGFYGNRRDDLLNESSPPGDGFLAEVCTAWEEAAAAAERFGARRVSLRFGVVLAPSGGMLKSMLPLFRRGLGAVMGDGRQYLAWISIDDAIGAILHMLDSDEVRGPVNLVSPNPVTVHDFTRALAAALHRPAFLRVPGSILRVLLGRLAQETLLSSARAWPKTLLDCGFSFRHPRLPDALSSLLG